MLFDCRWCIATYAYLCEREAGDRALLHAHIRIEDPHSPVRVLSQDGGVEHEV